MPVSSPIPDVLIPNVDVPTFFFAKAQVQIDAFAAAGVSEPPVVIDAASGRSVCLSDIKRSAQAIARGLTALLPSDHSTDRTVLVLLRNNILYTSIHHGILMAGCSHASLPPELDPHELADRLTQIGPASVVAAFVEDDAIDALLSATKTAGVRLPTSAIFNITGDQTHTALDDMIQENVDKPFTPYPFTSDALASMPALVIYTSGTSGTPKGIILTHRNILASNAMVGSYSARTAPIQDHHPPSVPDANTPRNAVQCGTLSALQPSHIYGHYVLSYMPLTHSGCIVILDHFTTHAYLDAIDRFRIMRISATPRMLHTLLSETTKVNTSTAQLRDHPNTRFRIDSVVAVGCGGSPLPPSLKLKYSEYFGGAPVIVGYGQTESSSVIAGSSWGIPAAPGAIGILYPNTTAKVVDAKGNETKELGELCISGPHVMKSYVGNVQSPIVDGFLHTGDYARLNPEGHVFLHGRVADVIYTSQGTIIPTDIEAILGDNPSIVDSAVVGVGAKGEAQAVVFLVLAPSNVPKTQALADVSQAVRSYTGIPDIVCQETTSIPKTGSGKIFRFRLLDLIHR
ncbi:4-coumarate--CoA ligase [Coemansia sp. RSA 1933]|nr:4-coumarate--CoA ligase [Coemansia sp. RSA 1933]